MLIDVLENTRSATHALGGARIQIASSRLGARTTGNDTNTPSIIKDSRPGDALNTVRRAKYINALKSSTGGIPFKYMYETNITCRMTTLSASNANKPALDEMGSLASGVASAKRLSSWKREV